MDDTGEAHRAEGERRDYTLHRYYRGPERRRQRRAYVARASKWKCSPGAHSSGHHHHMTTTNMTYNTSGTAGP